MVKKVEKIWLDGKLVPWDGAKVHVLTHTLHYGLGVFEGIRCYQCTDGRSAIFQLERHVKRLFESAHINLMKIPFTQQEIVQACAETVRVNKLKEAYIRPLVFIGDGEMGLHAIHNPIRVAIAAWSWGTYLGEDGVKNGIRAKISSYTRMPVNSIMTKSKTCGNYVNSIWAKREALMAGYEEAMMLDAQGNLVEATGENIFVIKDGVIRTPFIGQSILEGITRSCMIKLLEDSGHSVRQEPITRDMAYIADEIFLCGTAAELTPIRELDDRTIGSGKPGPITQAVQGAYFKAIRGELKPYAEWLHYL